MTRNRQKTLGLLLAVLLAAAQLLSFTTMAEADDSLTMWLPSNYITSDHLSYSALFAATGETITLQLPTADNGDYQTAYSRMLVSGDIPDLVAERDVEYPGGREKAVDDGFFLDLTPYLDQMPNFRKLLEEEDYARAAITDKGYIPGVLQFSPKAELPWAGLSIRKNILDAMDLEIPITIDDWHTVLSKYKATYGGIAPIEIGSNGLFETDVFLTAYGVLSEMYLDNGIVQYGPIQEGYRQYLNMMNKWYQEGLIDPNFMAHVSPYAGNWLDPNYLFSNASIAGYQLVVCSGTGYNDLMGFGLPAEEYWVATNAPVLREGDTPYMNMYISRVYDNLLAITSSCENIEAAIKVLDYMCTDDAAYYVSYGVEGVTYVVDENGVCQYSDFILHNPDGLTVMDAISKYLGVDAFGMYFPEADDVVYATPQLEADQLLLAKNDTSLCIPSMVKLPQDVAGRYSEIMSDVETYVSSETVKFITGERTIDQFDIYVEHIKNMGIAEAVQYMYDAYTNYISRGV